MSQFSSQTFSAARYLACRPTYPSWIYKRVFAYHNEGGGSWDQALDVGCGPGISTLPLLPHFTKVICIDPSNNMIQTASSLDQNSSEASSLIHKDLRGSSADLSAPYPSAEFRKSSAEDLSWLPDSSVDLVVSGQAAHWFSYGPFWKTLTRVMKPGGTVALWGYAEFFLPEYPATRSLINAYSAGKEKGQLGPYWQQPGRGIVERGLTEVPFPWEDPVGLPVQEKEKWEASSSLRGLASTQGLTDSQKFTEWPSDLPSLTSIETLDKKMTWDQLAGYLQTFSALHAYEAKNGKEEAREASEGILKRLKEEVGKVNKGVEDVLVRWPLVLVLCRKIK